MSSINEIRNELNSINDLSEHQNLFDEIPHLEIVNGQITPINYDIPEIDRNRKLIYSENLSLYIDLRPNRFILTKKNFKDNDLTDVKVITIEERQKEVKKEFYKIKQQINKSYNLAYEHGKKIFKMKKYEDTTEQEHLKAMEIEQEAINNILLDCEFNTDNLTEEKAQQLKNSFEIIFYSFLEIRNYYKPFLSSTDPTAFKTVNSIFALNSINFKYQPKLYKTRFNKVNNRGLLRNLLTNLCEEIERVKEKREEKERFNIYSNLKKLDDKAEDFGTVLKMYYYKLIDEFKSKNAETSKTLIKLGHMTQTEINENENYFNEVALQTALKMCDPDEPLLKMFYSLNSEIIVLFNESSRKNYKDYKEIHYRELIKMYKTLLNKLNGLFNDYFKRD